MKKEFLELRKKWLLKELTNEEYLKFYYYLGKKYNLILYYPL